MTAAGVVTITTSVPIYGRNLKGRVLAVRSFACAPTPRSFSGYQIVACVALPPGMPGVGYPLADWEWVRVA